MTAQNPAGGQSVEQGTSVSLVVSLGVMPDILVWQARYPGANLSDPAADADGDGLSNREERLWGLDPTDARFFSSILDPPNRNGIFRYTRRDPARTGATYSIWVSANLSPGSWLEDTGALQVSGGADANHAETVTVTLSPALLGGERLFVQVRAVE